MTSDEDKKAKGPTPEADENIRALAEEMEETGFQGSPLVVHGDQVVGGLDRYEAARLLGIEREVPRIPLEDVFLEAGVDMPQVASREGGPPSNQELFEDYLRELPRHVRDKYEL